MNRVRLIGRYFITETTDPGNTDTVKSLMQKWYTIHAKALLTNRTDIYWPYFERLGAKTLELQFRRMQKRWGSCSPTSKVVLNTELVKAPLHSIDYVIVHELCHLIAPNHDNKFYRLLNRITPDWEKRKQRLERVEL